MLRISEYDEPSGNKMMRSLLWVSNNNSHPFNPTQRFYVNIGSPSQWAHHNVKSYV